MGRHSPSWCCCLMLFLLVCMRCVSELLLTEQPLYVSWQHREFCRIIHCSEYCVSCLYDVRASMRDLCTNSSVMMCFAGVVSEPATDWTGVVMLCVRSPFLVVEREFPVLGRTDDCTSQRNMLLLVVLGMANHRTVVRTQSVCMGHHI